MFEAQLHRDIYAACYDTYFSGQNLDYVTATCALGDDAKREAAVCADIAPHPDRASDYSLIVRENWRKREVQARLYEIAEHCGERGILMRDIISELGQVVALQEQIENSILDSSAKPFKQAILEWQHSLNEKPTGIKTGFSHLDNVVGGFHRSGLYVISARPGGGKTDFALNVATNMASAGHKVIYCTMEMRSVDCVERIASRATMINSAKIRDRKLSDDDMREIIRVSGIISDSPIVIDEQVAITIADVKSKILKHRPDVMFIDNLQNMGFPPRYKNQWEAIAATTTALKQIAMRNNIAIVLLAQANREMDKGGKPQLGNLRGSSQIEADSDGVAFLTNEKKEGLIDGNSYIETKLSLSKFRNAATCSIMYQWQPHFHRFYEAEERY